MSVVKVTQKHNLNREDLRQRVDEIATELGQRFDLKSSWKSDESVEFNRSGLQGSLNLGDDQVDVNLKLGLMLGALKGPIERELKEQMKKRLT